MVQKLINSFKKYGFEILLLICIIFILLGALYNTLVGKKGTYAPNKYTIHYLHQKFPKSRDRTYERDSDNGQSSQGKKESKGEAECRRVLQKIFGRPFLSQRPDFLRNPVTGGEFNLELDCYNSELKLAIEYNGIQHYKYVPYFHKNYEHFINQKYRDDMKRRMCKDNGIILIEVPYTVKLQDIEQYIINACKKYNIYR
jgi:hypothetical protein